MEQCRLFEEGGRAHFMIRRFDRPDGGGKMHYASLFGIAHMAYAAPGVHGHSYEDYFEVIEKLELSPEDKVEAFRRMAFNVLAANRDNHSKNFGFLYEDGNWVLSPAFDVTYAHNPEPGKWTAAQQMSVMGKREGIEVDDLLEVGRRCTIATRPKIKAVVEGVIEALKRWSDYAERAGVSEESMEKISRVITAR